MATLVKQIDPLLKEFLDLKADQYESIDFVENDPISIPHNFTLKEDIEIAGFLTATIAWGKRVSIIKNATRILDIMDHSPHDFIINHELSDLKVCEGFVHRTFNACDLVYFFTQLKTIYLNHNGLESVMASESGSEGALDFIPRLHQLFFDAELKHRTQKHLSNPLKGSASKRINMFLRWMVRDSKKGVDFGIWKSISPSQLSIPLDVHTGNVGRSLGLLTRKQNDWKAVKEFDESLRSMNASDPVRYDYALFGIGVNKDLDYKELMNPSILRIQ
ncbi:MAG: hypothetical protein ACI8XB_000553 [Patiriisocius sp.]|jgi:uncharacterized protein (TIGR02757 family)